MSGFADIALVSLAVAAASAYLLRAVYKRWAKRGGGCGGCGSKCGSETPKGESSAMLTIKGRSR